MSEKYQQRILELEEETAKLKQEVALLKSQLFLQTSPTTTLGFSIFSVYPPRSNPPFKDLFSYGIINHESWN